MELILIACCQRKSPGGIHDFKRSNVLDSVSSSTNIDELMNARWELANNLNLSPGFDLGFDQHNQELKFLPAYQRYTGNVYKSSQISCLLPQATSIQVLIISALYGLLDSNDLIREYNVAMNDTLPNGTKLKTWWKYIGLGAIVEECIQVINPSKIYDLLSGHYREALQPWPPDALTQKVELYNYPGQGSGSNWGRGKDLKGLLITHTNH